MNGPLQVAQASDTAASSTGTPVRIYKLTKPLTDQAVMVNLGHDQKVKVDFSAIANEKITLVHVGEKLIILFDNQSTVTVEPVFKSRADGLEDETRDDITVEMTPGRDISLSEFATLFPITTDVSVLPAADQDGNSNANAQASGAHFTPPEIDPLPPVPTNVLAPQEELPTWTVEFPTGFLPIQPVVVPNNPAPSPGLTIVAGFGLPLAVDESFIPGIGSQVVVAGSPTSNIATQPFAASFTVNAPAGVQSIAYALTISNATTNLIDSFSGQVVHLVQNGTGEVDGVVTINNVQTAVFTLALDGTGHVTMTELRAVHQDQGTGEISLSAGLVSLTATVTDNNNTTASASIDLGPLITVYDDVPHNAAINAGPALTLSDANLTAATNNGVDGTAHNLSLTSVMSSFAAAFGDNFGADGKGPTPVSYALSTGNGGISGLTDSQTQQSDVLVQVNPTTIEGHVGGAAGALAFTISVDPTSGQVTFTGDRAVDNNGGSASLVANALTLTQTITDADGSRTSASLNIGAQFTLTDDGPIVTVTAANEPALTLSETHLTAGTNDIDGSVPSLELTSTTGNFAVDFTDTSGADGTRTVAYALSIVGGNGTPSGLTDSQTGSPDVLFFNTVSGAIEGHVGTTTGALAFTIAVDPATGIVTFTEDRAVVETQVSNTNLALNIATIASNVVTLTQTITDNDGTHASASLDLGSQLSMTDDGPHATLADVNLPALTLSETHLTAGTNGIDGSAPNAGLTSTTGNFGVDFTDTSGADGTRTVAYALSIVGGNGTPSGLTDSQTGSPDVLFFNTVSGAIEGHVGTTTGALAFTIAVDPATGIVTFTEDRAVVETQVSNTNLALNIATIASNVVTLTQTITDNDGTHASPNLDLGSQLSMTDDGPSVVISGAAVPALTLSETHLTAGTNGIDGSAPSLELTSTTGNFAVDFTDTSGADGTRTVAYALSIVGGNGTPSGLTDSQTGSPDVLFFNTGTGAIEGHVGTTTGLLAFTIAVDPATGVVTFSEDRAVVETQVSNTNLALNIATLTAGVVELTQTITDNDGTHAPASLDLGSQLSMTDDGPSVVISGAAVPALTLSETHLTAGTNDIDGSVPSLELTSTTGNFAVDLTDTSGADGTRTVAYALSIVGGNGTPSGLTDSQTGSPDVLFFNTGTGAIEGHVGTTTGLLAFTIAVDPATGIVTFTEDRAVVETQVSNTNLALNIATIASNVVTLTQTITDNDGTHASASLDLGSQLSMTDDGPHATLADVNLPALTLSETHLTAGTNGIDGSAPNAGLTSTTGNFGVDFTDTSGADGTRTVAYALSIVGGNGTPSGLTDSQTGSPDVLFFNTGTGAIEGRVGTTTGALAFTISVDPATGIVTFTEDRAVNQTQDGANPSGIPASFTAGVLTLTQTITDNDGTHASPSLDLGSQLSITDDGPIVTVTAANEPSLTLSETHLTTATNPDNGTAPNAALTSTTGNFALAFNDTPGADGTRTIAYALSITGGSGTASGLVDSHTQQSDVLVQVNATTIEGHVGSAGGALAFTISVASTGVVTFTEDRAVVQAQSGSNPSATPALFTAGVVTLTQTVTDNDGTVASASLDLGAKLSITDDGPIVTVTAANEPSLTLSETHLTTATNPDNGTSPNLPLTSTTGNFVVAFNDTPGADGTRTTTYALSITGGSGVSSGLTDSHTQLSDVLVQVNATTIEGHVGTTGGALAFTISFDPATGLVTFTEDRAVVQAQSGSNPSATPALFTAGVLTLTQTVTDNDGTVASASLDLGAKLSITDDGPIVTVTAANEPSLTLSETHLTTATNPDNGTAPNAALTSTTGNFALAFNDTPGADGTRTIAYALSITGGSGTASGLVDSHTQQSDVLVQVNATTIEGHVGSAGGALAFTISVASNGVVTFTEDRAVVQAQSGSNPSATPALFTAGVVTLTQTVTDNDGTVASASLDLGAKLSITDDGPIVTVTAANEPSLTLSETHLTTATNPDNGTSPNLPLTTTTGNFVVAFNDTPGADGTRTIAYALSINGTASGLVDSHTGSPDVLVQVNATTIEGHVGSAGGALAFTISVASNGVVTFTEDRAVVQAQSGSNPSATPALFTAGVVTLTQTVTDNDGTVASASLDLGAKLSITDDGPIVTVTAANEPSLTLSETHLTTATNPDNGTAPNSVLTSTTGNFAAAFNDTPGADGTRTIAYALSITGGSGTASGLVDSHTQQSDVLVQVNATTIEGHVGSAGGALAFTISVASTGVVTFTEDRAVVQAQSGSNPSATPALFTAGVVTLTQTVTDNDGTVASASLDLGAKLSITDDGPIVTVTAANEPSLTLSETHLTTATNPDNGTSPNLPLTTTTGNFVVAFNDTPGADGTRTIAYALSITGGSGTASGLVDLHTRLARRAGPGQRHDDRRPCRQRRRGAGVHDFGRLDRRGDLHGRPRGGSGAER